MLSLVTGGSSRLCKCLVRSSSVSIRLLFPRQMEQSPILGPIFHARVTSQSSFLLRFSSPHLSVVGLLSLLFVLDYLFISSAYHHTIIKGASVQIVFGFEVRARLNWWRWSMNVSINGLVRNSLGIGGVDSSEVSSSFDRSSHRWAMGKQRCLHALFGSCSWFLSAEPLHDLYHCNDEDSYIPIICYSTNVHRHEVRSIRDQIEATWPIILEHSANRVTMWSNLDVLFAIWIRCIRIWVPKNWRMWPIPPASFAEKTCKLNKALNDCLVNTYSTKIVYAPGFNVSRLVSVVWLWETTAMNIVSLRSHLSYNSLTSCSGSSRTTRSRCR